MTEAIGRSKAPQGGLTILYQDQWLLAVDKPQGILVHGDGTGDPTLTDALAAQLAAAGTDPGDLQALQRLDRETSGIVLFSLDKRTQPTLDALIASRQVSKGYLALVAGNFPQGLQSIDLPLARDRHDARRMRAVSAGRGRGQEAHTRALLLATSGTGLKRTSLLGVDLLTGRRHQIRVHLAGLGFPLVGDTLYGGRPNREGLMLHAFEESLTHPVTGAVVRLRTPVPDRFARAYPLAESLWDTCRRKSRSC